MAAYNARVEIETDNRHHGPEYHIENQLGSGRGISELSFPETSLLIE